jgi:hypothetical protein
LDPIDEIWILVSQVFEVILVEVTTKAKVLSPIFIMFDAKSVIAMDGRYFFL